MQSTLRLSLQAWVSETVRGITESSRVLVSYYGERVGTPSKSDFASSLIQEISKRVIKFVSQSGKSCLQVQGATAKQWNMYNSGFTHTHTDTTGVNGIEFVFQYWYTECRHKPEPSVEMKELRSLTSNPLLDFRHFPILFPKKATMWVWMRKHQQRTLDFSEESQKVHMRC